MAKFKDMPTDEKSSSKKGLVFMLYFICAGMAALINFSSRFFYNVIFSYGISVVFAYLTGMLVNFLLSKHYVFNAKKSGQTLNEAWRFILGHFE